MAPASPIDLGDADERTDLRTVGRSALWAGCALVSMLGAIMTARSDIGARRINEALNLIREPAETIHAPVPQIAYDPTAEAETRRLSERLKTLSADRERLLARLEALEHAVDVTGSIPRTRPAPLALAAPDPTSPERPVPEPKAPEAAASVQPPADAARAATPAPSQREAPPVGDDAPTPSRPVASVTVIPPQLTEVATTAAASEPERMQEADTMLFAATGPASEQETTAAITGGTFGIDLGGAPDAPHLRALWSIVRAQHGQLLEGLRPVFVHLPHQRHNALHLLAGPFRDRAAAARVCAVLAGTGRACQPGPFDPMQQAAR